MSKIRPLRDGIVVRRVEGEERSAGGIVIPDTAKEKPAQGIVVAVGPGKVLDNGDVRMSDIKADDRVLFGKYAGTEVKVNDQDLVVLREDDVLAIIE